MPSPWPAVEAGTDLLARARQIQRSWESLLIGGALDPELPARATAGMRPMIVESWRRLVATGLDPTDVLPSIEADPAETRERWLEHPLGLLRHVLVEPLQLLAEESNSVVQVTDPSGLTLYLGGPEALKARAAEMNLVEGARCSETVNGTNGVGTALAEDRPVQVFAFEHFSRHHREWVCSGAPIHDPVSGRLVGVIDLSSPWKIAHPRSLELVTSAARTTEQCLLERRRDQDARLRRRYGDLLTKSSDLLVDRDGYLLIGDGAAPRRPLDIPENGGEIALGEGSLAVAEPLGRGEAYLVRRPGPGRATAARRAVPATSSLRPSPEWPERAAPQVESGPPRPRAGERLSAYLEAAIDCVVVADASGRIVEFNPAAERTFGYSREEALGRTMAELIVPPSLRERHIAAFARFVETREGRLLGRRMELTAMRADGSEFPVELALSQVETEPVLICGALRDISAAKQTESHLRELAEEQAALRRVATLVACESSPERLVAVVAEQVAQVFDVPLVKLIRYEPTAAVVVGGFSEGDDEPFPIGSRWQLDTPLLTTIRQNGRAARVEDYAQAPDDGAGAVRAAGMRSAVGSPIIVGGCVWGAIVVLSPRSGSLPEDTEARLADFTELVATALANAESRAALSRLADEQAALRRVATIVARAPASEELFATVAREVASVLDVPGVIVTRYDADGAALTLGEAFRHGLAGAERFLGLGARMPREPGSLAAQVFDTHATARVDDVSTLPGTIGDVARAARLGSACAGPIVVNGAVWGKMCAFSQAGTVLPAGTEDRLNDFIELLATAIANHEARAELAASEARARELADEQAALRRVATLVAREASPVELLATVATEVARVLDVAAIGMLRFEPDGTATLVAQSDTPWDPPPLGTRLTLEGENVVTAVFRTGEAARLDDWTNATGPVAEMARVLGIRSGVATPIVVEGRLWGTLIAVTSQSEPLPRKTDSRMGEFTELVATAIASAEARDELSMLVEEQAALRRVATLVAKGATPNQVFDAVRGEVEQMFGIPNTIIMRFDADDSATLLATPGDYLGPVGARWRLKGDDSAVARVYRRGRAARGDYTAGGRGPFAEAARLGGTRFAVAVPVVVDGALWGAMSVGSPGPEPPPNLEGRLAKFTGLLGTAIANAEARAEVQRLADEQAALRRVATLVAEGASPDKLFAAAAGEVADVLGIPVVGLHRFEGDGTFTVVGIAGKTSFAVGTRWPVEDEGLAGMILATGRPARKDDYATMPGSLGAAMRDDMMISAVGVPIVVEGAMWGFMVGVANAGTPIPDDTEKRFARFTALVATAVANTNARQAVSRMAEEQAALRRVATMVARTPASEELFSAIAREVASALAVPGVIVTRYEPDGTAVTFGEAFGPDLEGAEQVLGLGTSMPPDPGTLTALVFDTHDPARVDHLSTAPGAVGEAARAARLGSGCAGPIVVNGTLWGKMCVFSPAGTVLPAGTEDRLHDFVELVATAIANSEARAELAASEARASELADEQAALRRVATLVARGVEPEEMFFTVTNEMAHLFGTSRALVGRVEPDGSAYVVVGASSGIRGDGQVSIGSRWEFADYMASAQIYRTGRPVRLDRSDFEHASGPMADVQRAVGAVSIVGAPIVVEGKQWGFVTLTDVNTRLPADAEKRLEKFAELVATAIANAESRAELAASEAELAASRVRVIAAADESRRRIERDLHDGAQQQLVTLAVALQRAQARIPSELGDVRADVGGVVDGLRGAIDALRDLSRGIHPAILTEGGLSPALKALGRRTEVRVKLDVGFEHRLPNQVEVAAYYTISEALTNASKHARASRVWVSLRVEDDMLVLAIRDDGVGGADASRGSGLTGLRDRIEALGGTIRIKSPSGAGTRIDVGIPIGGPADRSGKDGPPAHATTPMDLVRSDRLEARSRQAQR
jgi:PAS domain S-box-containing protein